MANEELLHPVVVPLAVCPDGEEVLDDHLGCVHAPALNGPHQRRNALSADLNREQPLVPQAARRALHGLPQRLHGVGVDRLHDDCGALLNRPDQHLRDQRKSPAEGVQGVLVLAAPLHLGDAAVREGTEELGGDAVGNVSEPEGRYIVGHVPRVAEALARHPDDALGDEVEALVRLLKEGLPSRVRTEERVIDRLAILIVLAVGEAPEHAVERTLPHVWLPQVLLQEALDVVPEPVPRHLVVRVPVLRQEGPQRRQHAGLELGQVDVGAPRGFADPQRQDVALLLQADRVLHVHDDVLEAAEHLLQPRLAGLADAHDCGVDLEHALERRGHALAVLHQVGLQPLAGLVRRLRFRAQRLRRLAAGLKVRLELPAHVDHDILDLVLVLVVFATIGLLPALLQGLQPGGIVPLHEHHGAAHVVQHAVHAVLRL
mmetsp:Transcript_10785/g.27781  ORF Transcript_10785/g.27781 Transcript_10785/m.27781 type:complete len:430 (-) Transcript_10785:961-2250(-)